MRYLSKHQFLAGFLIVFGVLAFTTSPDLQAAEKSAAKAAKKTATKAEPESTSPGGKYAKEAEELYLKSFRTENPPAWMEKAQQDETMKICAQYRDQPPAKLAEKIMADNLASIHYPADGKFIGDWKNGEKLANIGTGGQMSTIQPDPPNVAKGGNCYACHQMAKREVAYGTIGPSLSNYVREYGETRGEGDIEKLARFVYEKIYNSNAYYACSNMPRFGYHNWLTEKELTDLVAYLVDPASPVNQE